MRVLWLPLCAAVAQSQLKDRSLAEDVGVAWGVGGGGETRPIMIDGGGGGRSVVSAMTPRFLSFHRKRDGKAKIRNGSMRHKCSCVVMSIVGVRRHLQYYHSPVLTSTVCANTSKSRSCRSSLCCVHANHLCGNGSLATDDIQMIYQTKNGTQIILATKNDMEKRQAAHGSQPSGNPPVLCVVAAANLMTG